MVKCVCNCKCMCARVFCSLSCTSLRPTKQTINVTVELGYMTAKANIANNCVAYKTNTQPCTMNANANDVDDDDDFAKTNRQSKARQNSYMRPGKALGSIRRWHKHSYTQSVLAGYSSVCVCVRSN